VCPDVVLDRGCHLVHQIRPRNIEHAIERLAGLRCRETLTGTEHLVVYRRDLVPMAVTAGLHISFHYWLIERNLVYNRVSVTTSESGSPQAAILGLPTPQFPDFLQPDPGGGSSPFSRDRFVRNSTSAIGAAPRFGYRGGLWMVYEPLTTTVILLWSPPEPARHERES
jgi:hypothetical protein